MFDRFFDTLYVCNFTNVKLNRKVFQQPYHSSSDFRLKVWNMHSKCTFFLYHPIILVIVSGVRVLSILRFMGGFSE